MCGSCREDDFQIAVGLSAIRTKPGGNNGPTPIGSGHIQTVKVGMVITRLSLRVPLFGNRHTHRFVGLGVLREPKH
jgi:hypothetical protein